MNHLLESTISRVVIIDDEVTVKIAKASVASEHSVHMFGNHA